MFEIGRFPEFCHIRLPQWQDGTAPGRAVVEQRFAPDYAAARAAFIALARDAGARLFSYPIEGSGLHREALSIDIAELGTVPLREAKSALVVISGVHGSEGRAGSAIQQHLLAANGELPPDCTVVLVHALNPHGMSHERRNTESNVDLNRNYTRSHAGIPEHYAEARRRLSPENASALEMSLRYFEALSGTELKRLLQILAPGQYEFPGDPFFGGRELEPNVRILQEHLRTRLGAGSKLLFVDIHTGLGAGGDDTLFFLGENPELRDRLARSLGPRHLLRDPRVTIPFFDRVHGSIAGGLVREFADHRAGSCVVEIGTYPNVLLSSQILETYCRRFADSSLADSAREFSRESFCPDNQQWRTGVLQRGADILRKSLESI